LEHRQAGGILLEFEIRLAKQSIGFEVFGMGFQDVEAMSHSLAEKASIQHRFDLAVIRS
jgi:hypothetical protein